ncbi:hypothetical protein B4127_1461 [Bacillus pumilus]|uniref:Lipoprotein n=1 Tax=Bacillus pumilus TaxID=1408 RepID=A0AB34QTA0_BACPU|nr:hypothetical protein [Bacillus pumilus]KIL12130.1 hypothetical protein B4127_1461 [Bacillus pumilus]
MNTKSKKAFIFMFIVAVFMLSGCAAAKSGNEKESSKESASKTETPKVKTMLISEAFNRFSVWLITDGNPGRSSKVESIIAIKDGEIARYRPVQPVDIRIEHLIKLSDKEIIELFEKAEGYKFVGKYKLGIILDQVGQTTERMKLTVNQKTMTTNIHLSEYMQSGENRDQAIKDFQSGKRKVYNESLANSDIVRHDIKGEYSVTTKIVKGQYSLNLFESFLSRTIFDTTYLGVSLGNKRTLITRVDESVNNFNLDTPEKKGKKVIIEGITK